MLAGRHHAAAKLHGGSINSSSCCCRGETEIGSSPPTDRPTALRSLISAAAAADARIGPADRGIARPGFLWDSPQLMDPLPSIIVLLKMSFLHDWLIVLRCCWLLHASGYRILCRFSPRDASSLLYRARSNVCCSDFCPSV